MSARSNFDLSRGGRSVPRRLHGGDEHGGFEVDVDRIQSLVRMRLWGVWHMQLADEFYARASDLATSFAGKRWAIIADSRDFAAQSPEVARLRQDAMKKVRASGCDKIAAIADKAVYAMQFKRIAEESHVGSAVFHDEESALAWIRSK